jgi:hypothetical protein
MRVKGSHATIQKQPSTFHNLGYAEVIDKTDDSRVRRGEQVRSPLYISITLLATRK